MARWNRLLAVVLVVVAAVASLSARDSAVPPAPPVVLAEGPGVMGDVNCSGAVDSVDSLQVLRLIAGLSTNADCMDPAGDTDCDGDTDSVDSLRILRYVAALSVSAPQGCAAIGETLAAPPTSYDLIDDAVEAGEISEGTGILYEAYAAFGDPRLPAEYAGAPVGDLFAPIDIWERPEGLAPEIEEGLAPYLLPPPAEGSWYSLRATASSMPQVEIPPGDWHAVPAGPVKAWWDAARPEDQAKAQEIAAEASVVWPDLQAALGVQPPSDAGVDTVGGDGLYDIYVAPLDAFGYLGYFSESTEASSPCTGVPSYLVYSSAEDAEALAANVGDGLVRAFLAGVTFADSCGSRRWLVNALEAWGEDFVDPDSNIEHEYGGYFRLHGNTMSWGNDGRGAYIFFLYLSRAFGAGVIAGILDEADTHPVYQAIDAAIPGGFTERLPEFGRYGWNQGEWDMFREWDGITDSPSPFHADSVSLDTEGEWTSELAPLSVDYVQYSIEDDVVGMTVSDPLPANPAVRFQLLVFRTDGPAENLTLPKQGSLPFCQAENPITRFVVVATNSALPASLAGAAAVEPPPFISTAPACGPGDWLGEAHAAETELLGGETRTRTASASGIIFAEVPCSGVTAERCFDTIGGTVYNTFSGYWTPGCVASGEATLEIEEGDGYLYLYESSYEANLYAGGTIPVTIFCNGVEAGTGNVGTIAVLVIPGNEWPDKSIIEGEYDETTAFLSVQREWHLLPAK